MIPLVIGTVSFSSLAAELLTKDELSKNPDKFIKIGTITTTAKTTSPSETRQELSKLADNKGGKYYVIIAGREHGKYSAIAEVYNEKK